MALGTRHSSPLPQRVDTRSFAAALGDWSDASGPLYSQLSRAIFEAVSRGDLELGVRLPPERALAEALGVSRSTVVAAYDYLRQSGIVQSKQGSGTWIAAIATDSRMARPQTGLLPGPDSTGPDRGIFLTMGNLPASEMVKEAIAQTAEDFAERSLSTHGYEPHGQYALRAAIAEHYQEQGLPTTPDEVLVTTGSQQAIALVGSVLLSPGDTVVVEDPTYSGALDCFRGLGVRIVALPLDEGGIRVDLLRSTVASLSPKLIYVCPVSNPTGRVMSESTRVELTRLADRFSVPVVEDRALAHVTFDVGVPPPTTLYSTTGEMVVVGSASKIFWGGLRIGWVRASRSFIQRVYRQKATADLGSAVFDQLVVAKLLPQIAVAREVIRREASARLDLLTERLAERLPSWRWERPHAGLCLWTTLPHGNSTDLAAVAHQHGVMIVPGPTMSAEANFSDCLRLPFALEPRTIEEGVERLAAAWSAYEQTVGSRTSPSLVV